MQETSTSPATILQFRQDIEAQFRRHIREACRPRRGACGGARLGAARTDGSPSWLSERQHRTDDHHAGGNADSDGASWTDRRHGRRH